ncbi:thiamine phosphate synthase [bacterium]|nr:thiamine phosphate synthase [bacterium]
MMEYRMIDANLNRLGEGLRVIEDFCRFGLNDTALSARIKRLRHDAGALRRVFPPEVLDRRDSAGDVGRIRVKEPMQRADRLAILGASFGRVQEAIRVLEEVAKLDRPQAAAQAKAMRYEAYELERMVVPLFDRAEKAARLKGLYLILTDPVVGYEKLAEIAVAQKVGAIQLRAKRMDGGPLLELARRVREITRGSQTLFFINDRPDIAQLVEADGVHLGQTDLSVTDARAIVGGRMLIGKSTHNRKQLAAALKEKPDYVGIGPVFETGSKADHAPVLGIEKASAMLRAARGIPAVAVGGINDRNLIDLFGAGFNCYALIAAVCGAADPKKEIRKFMRKQK